MIFRLLRFLEPCAVVALGAVGETAQIFQTEAIRMTKLDEKTLSAKIEYEQKRTLANIALRTERPAMAYWLSFADEDGFRGAVIVHAEDLLTAIMECNLRDINPHGECQGIEIPAPNAAQIPEKWKYRILSRVECVAFDAEMCG